ncbi:hypothetical protein CCHOA_09830 [Corynebacterium choanae]|uniref:Uncharacterized protein n=2 Tax=Corynebacterium choanae TaxID=1862358 RepID=A0A3G6J8W5_9CORY|nr:hypothetical protein CCHOA_09830 [Corynebacterium choanae]
MLVGHISLVSCSDDTDLSDRLKETARESQEFTLNEALSIKVKEAYIFCPYTDWKDGVAKGFSRDQFYSIDDNYKAWETYSGLGIIPAIGDESKVLWFSPRELNFCPTGYEGLTQLAGNDVITVSVEEKEFADGTTSPVRVLQRKAASAQ